MLQLRVFTRASWRIARVAFAGFIEFGIADGRNIGSQPADSPYPGLIDRDAGRHYSASALTDGTAIAVSRRRKQKPWKWRSVHSGCCGMYNELSKHFQASATS